MTPAAPDTVFDRELALARVGGDEELLRELAQLFLQDYPRLMAELRQAWQRGNAKQVEEIAHGLKGSVANFGAKRAVEAAYRIEQLGRQARLEPVAEAVHSLDLILLALHSELAAF